MKLYLKPLMKIPLAPYTPHVPSWVYFYLLHVIDVIEYVIVVREFPVSVIRCHRVFIIVMMTVIVVIEFCHCLNLSYDSPSTTLEVTPSSKFEFEDDAMCK